MSHQYRKKPVVIEAFQLHPNDDATRAPAPPWLLDAIMSGAILMKDEGGAQIKTLEGTMTGDVGDWIIRGVKGEMYPCKPDIFAATYDPA